MVISDHYVDLDDRSWFTVNTPEFDITENILAQHMLSMDPTRIELYQYFNSITIARHSKPSETYSLGQSDMDDSVHSMVMDYFEVDCCLGAFNLIETAMISNQKPTTTVLLAILDVLLKERSTIDQYQLKNDWILVEKSRDLLQDILFAFGPRLFDGIWDTFDQFHLAVVQEQRYLQHWSLSNYSPTNNNNSGATESGDNDGDDDSLVEETFFHGFKGFRDFWAFTSHCFNTNTNIINAKSCNHALDILVTLLEQDFQSKKSSYSYVKTTILLKTLQKNFEGRWDQFEKYIDILLLPFNVSINSDVSTTVITVQKEIAGRLMNLFIAISQYEEMLPVVNIAEQLFRKATSLGTSCLMDFIEYIYFDSFILLLCQCGFIEADWSLVPQEYRGIKWENTSATEKTSKLLDKWVGAFTKTKPVQIAWENIYLHIFLIKQYYNSILKISALRYDSEHHGTLITRGYDDVNDDTLFALLDDTLTTHWRHQVDKWANQCLEPSKDWKQRVDCLLDALDYMVK